MRGFRDLCGFLVLLLLVGLVAWVLGLNHIVMESIAAGHLLDWIMGVLCLVWLVFLLDIPWDLYFQAHRVLFELDRSEEKNIAQIAGRREYLLKLRRRLGWFAVGAHLFSALMVAAIAHYSMHTIGYYFAAFYLVSVVFRPAVALFYYLTQKLRAIEEEARYPREDIGEMRERLRVQENTIHSLVEQMEACEAMVHQEAHERRMESAELRQSVHSISREFETTVSKISDNQELIRGVQAFVRLIASSAQSTA